MRIVLDTNVFVSAVLKANSLPFLVLRWIDQHGGLLKSAATEREILSVLARPHIAAVTIPTFRDDLARMLATAELVTITEGFRARRLRPRPGMTTVCDFFTRAFAGMTDKRLKTMASFRVRF